MPFPETDAKEGPVREGRYVVLAFLEAQDSWGPDRAARDVALGWLTAQMGRDIPEKAWTVRKYRADSNTSQLQTRRRRKDGGHVWAAWVRSPVDGEPDQCVITEVLVRVADSEVVCVGLRLLAEAAEDLDESRLRSLQARVALSGAIQSYCELYAALTGSHKPPAALRTERETVEFAQRLLDPQRAKPVIVISTRKGAEKPSAINFGSSRLARHTHGLADVFVLVARQTWVLKDQVGKKNSVFDGAARIYMPGLKKDSEPRRHKYWTVAGGASREKRRRVEMEIQAHAAAASAKAYRFDRGTLPYGWARRLKWRPIRRRRSECPPGTLPDADRLQQVPADTEPTPRGKSAGTGGRPSDFPKGWVGRLASIARDTVELWRDPCGAPARVLRAELAETERRLRESEENRIAIKKKATEAREWADALEAENDEIRTRLAAETERADRLDAQVKRLKPLPVKWDEFLGWCKRDLAGRLTLHPNVNREIQRAMHDKYEKVDEAAKGLRWLAEAYRDSRLHGAGTDLRGRIATVDGLHNEPCGQDAYRIEWNGKMRMVDWHLKHGTSIDQRRCLRIYYFWDDELGQAVIAHMPSHRGSPG